MILNLTVWFALHVLFARVEAVHKGPLILWTPDPASLDWRVVVLAAISAALLLYRHWNMVVVLAVAAAGGLVLQYV